MTDRIRIPQDLAQRVHAYSVRDARSFDGAARLLLEKGLRASTTPAAAPDLTKLPALIAEVRRMQEMSERLAAASDVHCAKREVREVPELLGLMRRTGTAAREVALGIKDALAALPERYKA